MDTAMNRDESQRLLAEYCDTRDIKLRNELVEMHMHLAESVARKYSGRGVEYEDLKQIAYMALISALERYSCTYGIRFSTFAVPTINGVVKNYFRDRMSIIRMPRGIRERVGRINLAKETLFQRLRRSPTMDEIAEECGYEVEKVLEALEATQSLQMTSLDMQVGEDGDTPLGELIGDEQNDYEKADLRDLVNRLLDQVSDTEKKVLQARFFENKTQRQIAAEINVSQMYVSRMEQKLLQRFRVALQDMH